MILNEKNGEQYSKKLELRKKEVVELYFNQRYSALQISKILEVNRNTVNKDVKFWYLELHNEKLDYSKNWLGLQFIRLESQ
jgi:transposase-like protein